jgi:pyridoxal phosphate enzyme (YggS family)
VTDASSGRLEPPEPLDPALVATFAAARAEVLERIAAAAARGGRDPAAVRLVAVSKTVPAERLRAAVAAGLETLGENRVQEAEAKQASVAGAIWHLVGPLQSNKARRAVEQFAVIQSVDSVALAQRLDRIAAEVRPDEPLPILLQVNVDVDAAKAGFDPAALEGELAAILELTGIAVAGLRTVGRLAATPELARPTFVALRALSERLRARHPELGPALSMGMSEDYPVAVEEGATHVRIGRAIFGARPLVG